MNEKRFKGKRLDKYERGMRRKNIFTIQVILLYLSILAILFSIFPISDISSKIWLLIIGGALAIIGFLLKNIIEGFH